MSYSRSMTIDEFDAARKPLVAQCSMLRHKNNPLIQEYNVLANKAGINPYPSFVGSPSWKIDKMTEEEICDEWRRELRYWQDLDQTIPAKIEVLKGNAKVKRSQEASRQKVGGMDDEVTFCNKYTTDPLVKKTTLHGRSKRPKNLHDSVVVEHNSEKRDVTLITTSDTEYRMSLKGDIDIVQWCLHATNEVGDYWGKEHPLYKFCACRDKHHDEEKTDVIEWVKVNLSQHLNACREMYREGIDKKTIYAFLRKHHTGFDDYMEERRKSFGVSEQLTAILAELNDIEKLRKFLTKYLTDDGNANVLGAKQEDGTYQFYKFNDIIDHYLNFGEIRVRAESIAIDVDGNPSITMEFRSKGKKSLFIRQEYHKGAGSLKNVLKTLIPVSLT